MHSLDVAKYISVRVFLAHLPEKEEKRGNMNASKIRQLNFSEKYNKQSISEMIYSLNN